MNVSCGTIRLVPSIVVQYINLCLDVNIIINLFVKTKIMSVQFAIFLKSIMRTISKYIDIALITFLSTPVYKHSANPIDIGYLQTIIP